MAVKHKIVESREAQDSGERLNTILRALQDIHANSEQQTTAERIKMCEMIVEGLGTVHMPKNPDNCLPFMESVKKIQDILEQACSNQHLILATLRPLFVSILDPQKDPAPTMSIVLQLMDVELIPKAVNYILRMGISEDKLEQALTTLCKWLSKWTWTPNLGPLVLTFMEGLEMQKHYDILVSVTLKYVERLFKLIILSENRNFVAPVVINMLRSMQHSPEAFHKIIPHVKSVLTYLHRENSESSLTYEKEIANLCIALINHFPNYPINEELKDVLQTYSLCSEQQEILKSCRSWQDVELPVNISVKTAGKVGLNNLGNTCYMNSVLQALFMTKQFRNDILLAMNSMPPVITKLQALFALQQFSSRTSLAPAEILTVARPAGFQQGHQHDSSEFLGHLLDILHEQERIVTSNTTTATPTNSSSISDEEDNKENGQNSNTQNTQTDVVNKQTVVQRTFGGRGVTESKCGACGQMSERADYFRELQLSFPNSDNQSVQTLVNYYVQPEKMCGDNQYRCDTCECLTDGERVTRVVEPPSRLILTLKQFRYDPASQQRTKILQRVKLDEFIQLENVQYELYASVVHCGSSVDSGHYYTFAKDQEDWFKFNDCSVYRTKPEELHSLQPPETPYILFYRRVESLEPPTLSLEALPLKLQTIVIRDLSDTAKDLNKTQLSSTTSNSFIKKNNTDEDPPPPGCGGGGLITGHNRFVC